jgi:hypothetical protein
MTRKTGEEKSAIVSRAHLFRFALERPGAGFLRTLNFRFVRIYTPCDELYLRQFERI